LPQRYLFGSSDVVVTTTHRLYIAAVVGAAAVFVAASITSDHNRADEHVSAPSQVSTPGTSSASTATSGLAPSPSAAPRSKRRHRAQHRRHQLGTPHPHSGGFSIVVKTKYGDIPARVGSISVDSNEPVDPPHSTAEQWNTAVWVVESSYLCPKQGHNLRIRTCVSLPRVPFTNLKAAAVGDLVVVMTPSAVLTYRVNRTGLVEVGELTAFLGINSTVVGRIVLVTCEYEEETAALTTSSS
jgi:hypothetical protein